MTVRTFKAFYVTETSENQFKRAIVERSIDDLPAGDVLIQVVYSSLNYKDALSATGNRGVTKKYPHTPGIDAAGVVVESTDPDLSPAEEVLVTGYDLGMNTAGGFGQFIRVPKEWVVKLPPGLTQREAMAYGTAGFTAALSVYKLVVLGGVKPEDGEVLVTGASGGVGSTAARLLLKQGYRVAGSYLFEDDRDFLGKLGLHSAIAAKELEDVTGRALLASRWAGVIDTVGANLLTTALKSTRYGGVVTCCGNAGGFNVPTTVYPFILRGVTLYGVDSVQCPRKLRLEIWKRLAGDWKLPALAAESPEIPLSGLDERIQRILKGQVRGRTIVRVRD